MRIFVVDKNRNFQKSLRACRDDGGKKENNKNIFFSGDWRAVACYSGRKWCFRGPFFIEKISINKKLEQKSCFYKNAKKK